MLLTQKQIEGLARKNGYEEARDYAMDNDLERCSTCGKWGKWGEDVMGDGTDNYCEEHRPAEAV